MRVQIPEGYHEITVAQFQALNKLNDSKLSEQERALAGIRILVGIDESTLLRLKRRDIARILGFLAWLDTPPPDDTPVIPHIVLDDFKYGFIPNWNALTLGEFVDLESISEIDIIENLHRLMGIMYRPVVSETSQFYSIEPYVPNAMRDDMMKHAPLSAALGAMVFFYRIGERLASDLQPSSPAAERAAQSQKSGDTTP
jgi:hypothetical protein